MDNKVLIIPDEVKSHVQYKKWRKFHMDNRNVIRLIIRKLDDAIAAGFKKSSVKMIINVIRYEDIVIKGTDDYKINDAYTGIYTHVILATFPKYKGLIDTRELRAINKPALTY